MNKAIMKKTIENSKSIQIIDNDYLYKNLEAELIKIDTYLLFINVICLKKIGLKIEAVIYKKDGISHQDCSATTSIIKSIIDKKHNNADDYTVTVSSPGFKWLFRSEKELEIFRNAPIKIIYNKESSEIINKKTVSGILLNYDDNSIEIENEKENITIAKEAIEKIYLNY